jgi:tripartite-type tricarboxylate transporter receptor subunit TctC
MVVSPARGWKTMNDAIAAAKAKPGALNYASAGTGSATHLNAEKFKLRAGIDAVHVPFKGTPEAVTEIIGGRIDWFFAPLASTLPLIREGKLQALAVSTPSRAPALADVPTTVEAGLADSSYVFWVGMIAPAGVPAAIQQKLNDEARKALASPEVRDRMARAGADPLPMSIADFNAFIRTEMDSAALIAKAANLKGQ